MQKNENSKSKVGAPSEAVRQYTRKEFREYLNQTHLFDATANNSKGKGGRFGATKRAYGDYLWSRDREMFEIDYQQFLKDRSQDNNTDTNQKVSAPETRTVTGESNAPRSRNGGYANAAERERLRKLMHAVLTAWEAAQ